MRRPSAPVRRVPTAQTAAPYDEIKAEAIAAERRGDLASAVKGWARARELAPDRIEATCREIELLLELQNFDVGHLRLVTALQKFSNQRRLIKLQTLVEQKLLGYHNRQALQALNDGDRRKSVYHYEMCAVLRKSTDVINGALSTEPGKFRRTSSRCSPKSTARSRAPAFT